jgi:hypothetical protein
MEGEVRRRKGRSLDRPDSSHATLAAEKASGHPSIVNFRAPIERNQMPVA